MKQNVNFDMFTHEFENMGRGFQFSHGGLRALFDYLEEYESETGTEIELDVIALCCDYAEITEQDAREQYDIPHPEDDDWIEWLRDQTPIIDVDDSHVIIQQY